MSQLGFKKGDTVFYRWAIIEPVGFWEFADGENLISFLEV